MINGKIGSKELSSVPCSPKSKYRIVSITSPKEKFKLSSGVNMYRSLRPNVIHTSPEPDPALSPQVNDINDESTMIDINKYINKSEAWVQSKSINGTIYKGRGNKQ